MYLDVGAFWIQIGILWNWPIPHSFLVTLRVLDKEVKYRFQGTFYCPKSSKKCVCILSIFYSQQIAIKWGFKHTFYYFSWIKSTLKPTFYYEKGGDFDFLHILRIKSPRRCLGLFIAVKCVKSQNHPLFEL